MTSPRRKGDITTTSTKKDHKREKKQTSRGLKERENTMGWVGGYTICLFVILPCIFSVAQSNSTTISLGQLFWNTLSPFNKAKKYSFNARKTMGRKKVRIYAGCVIFYLFCFCTMLFFHPPPSTILLAFSCYITLCSSFFSLFSHLRVAL